MISRTRSSIACRLYQDSSAAQASALLGAHGAVVEVEVQVADARVLLVEDLPVGVVRGQRRVDGCGELGDVELATRQAQSARRRELEERAVVLVSPLEVGDPHRAVHGRPADRAVALGDDLPQPPPQRLLAMNAEQVELYAVDRVEHAGVPLGGADLAHDRGGGVLGPVDRSIRLRHRRAQAAGHERIVVAERLC